MTPIYEVTLSCRCDKTTTTPAMRWVNCPRHGRQTIRYVEPVAA